LIEITYEYDGSHVLIMCVIGFWRHILVLSPTQCTHTHHRSRICRQFKHMWTIIRNFNQVQANTPWWWILYDPKHVGV